MIVSSRPLRFLVVVLGGWIGVRVSLLWPDADELVPALVAAAAPKASAATTGLSAHTATALSVRPPPAHAHAVRSRPRTIGVRQPVVVTLTPELALHTVEPGGMAPTTAPLQPIPPTLPGIAPPPTFATSRWSGSAWAIVRPDGRATPFASQLGGSQAGARIAYAVDEARHVAVYARASSAIDARQKEAAVGVDWRPTRAPVHLVAEQRIEIEGVRSGFALGAVGGVGPTRLAGPVRVEGYAQAGVIFRDGHEGYVDGSVRTTVAAGKRIDLGLGAWGGAQKGAMRVDVGPTIGVTLPVERRTLRLSVDWRQRVAGDARPGSGPALSLGTDF